MSVLQRYLFRQLLAGIGLVTLALVLLFLFFDLVDQLGDLGKGQYRLPQILQVVLLGVPGRLYQLLPMGALIGTVWVLGQLSAQHEYAVLRTAGVSPQRLVRWLMQLGLGLALFNFACGEWVAPRTEEAARRVRVAATASVIAQEFRSGLWVRDGQQFVNVQTMRPDGSIEGVRIYELGDQQVLKTVRTAARGHLLKAHWWLLEDVQETHFVNHQAYRRTQARWAWSSVLTPSLLAVLLVVPEQMSAWHLSQYVSHLSANHQQTRRYEIALWSKFAYPLATVVLMLLALPFVPLEQRSGQAGMRLFLAVMVGIGFHLSNRLFAHMGLLNQWPPLLSAFLPSVLLLIVAFMLTRRQEHR